MMTMILCLLPLPSDTQWWSIANLHDPRVTRTSRSSPPDSVVLVSRLDSNNLLQDLMRWSGVVQSGHVSEQHVTSFDNRLRDVLSAADQNNRWVTYVWLLQSVDLQSRPSEYKVASMHEHVLVSLFIGTQPAVSPPATAAQCIFLGVQEYCWKLTVA